MATFPPTILRTLVVDFVAAFENDVPDDFFAYGSCWPF